MEETRPENCYIKWPTVDRMMVELVVRKVFPFHFEAADANMPVSNWLIRDLPSRCDDHSSSGRPRECRGRGKTRFRRSTGPSQSWVGQTVSLTVPQGSTGDRFSGSVRSFVIGVIPIVGGAPGMISSFQGHRGCLVLIRS